MSNSLLCPLCGDGVGDEVFHREPQRDYYQCTTCLLVFEHPEHLPDAATEKNIYDQHENHPDDENYRAFLRRLTDPLRVKLTQLGSGLDFGSGPGPTLSLMLQEAGHQMQIYDPFYAPDRSVFDRQYDFITATEVFEHLHKPGIVINELHGLLKQEGWLGVMTKRIPRDKPFAEWHYTRDPTHVVFFADETFNWIAECFAMQCEFIDCDVVLLKKC